MKNEILLFLEYSAGPYFPPDDDTVDNMITGDSEFMNCNMIIQILFTSYYNLDVSAYDKEFFDHDQLLMDKNILSDLSNKMVKRLHELDDGTFEIHNTMGYDVSELEDPKQNGLIDGKRRVILRLDYHINPINTLDDLGRRTLENLPIIQNDQKVIDLSRQLQTLYDQCFTIEPEYIYFDFDMKFYQRNKARMDSLVKQIEQRLEEINDGSFIVENHIKPYYFYR